MNFNVNTEKYVIEKSYDFLDMNESKISELFKTEGELTIHDGMLKMKTTSNRNPNLHAAISPKFKLTEDVKKLEIQVNGLKVFNSALGKLNVDFSITNNSGTYVAVSNRGIIARKEGTSLPAKPIHYDLSKYPKINKDYTVQFDFVENSLSTFLGDQLLDKNLLGKDYFSYVKNHFSEFEMEFRIKNGYTGSPADFTQYHVEAGIRQIKFRLYY